MYNKNGMPNFIFIFHTKQSIRIKFADFLIMKKKNCVDDIII